MKRIVTVAAIVIAGASMILVGPVRAEKVHAPKGIWVGMMANLSEVQGIASAITVFDMKRAAELAESLTKRQHYLSGWDAIPEKWQKSYGELAKVTDELLAAAKAGDETETSLKLGQTLAACSACHYDLRDAKRRAKKK